MKYPARIFSAAAVAVILGAAASAAACDLRTAKVVLGCDCKWTLNVEGTVFPGVSPTPHIEYHFSFTNGSQVVNVDNVNGPFYPIKDENLYSPDIFFTSGWPAGTPPLNPQVELPAMTGTYGFENVCTGNWTVSGSVTLFAADAPNGVSLTTPIATHDSSVDNCGSCGNVCDPEFGTPACTNGACTILECFAGYADCNGAVSDGCENSLFDNLANCGACGHSCDNPHGASACKASACVVLSCNTGFADCDGHADTGCETNILGADLNNCGGCNVHCSAGATCVAGVCKTSGCSADTGGQKAVNASNFNGTAIAAGKTIWFQSVIKASNLPATRAATVYYGASRIQFTANGVSYDLPTPGGKVIFDPAATQATTTYSTGNNEWTTMVPAKSSGNVFLGGFGWQVPTNLAGGINPVKWLASFDTDTPGVGIQWQWAAAVYSGFSADNNAVQVKPTDDNKLSAYKNSDHAGTPEAFKNNVLGGARGGGGSNFTGSYSGTASVTPAACP